MINCIMSQIRTCEENETDFRGEKASQRGGRGAYLQPSALTPYVTVAIMLTKNQVAAPPDPSSGLSSVPDALLR